MIEEVDGLTLFPIQVPRRIEMDGGSGRVRKEVYMKAYEVYSHVFGPQEAMITGHCRSGFGTGEMIAFLYASSFPRHEWTARVHEALKGMNFR